MQHATDLLREVSDNRLLIENMPKVGLGGEAMIGYSPAQIEELIGDSDMGLCLDFGHAVKAAMSLGGDYKIFIKKILDLFTPYVSHLSDGVLNSERDHHLNIGDGEYDLKFIKNSILGNGNMYVTLETPRLNKFSLDEDIKNLECFHSLPH